ncbi:site-specific integrase [Cellulosilyticum sp. I15G10I2]|uniref:site-specific integrase n=1 Tax=Cellulosilyticum sp. I15G10I2 TaxID=1892843 RepID=UPI00085BE28E|nr:site-specific integrase [Cellulosilyticum sp. I15G10I2]
MHIFYLICHLLEYYIKVHEFVSDKPQSRLAFMLLFWTGMRCGELLALSLKYVDLDAKIINVSKSYARLNKEDLINPPKTPKSKRIITIPHFLVDEINNYVALLYDYQATDRLFTFSKHLLVREMNTNPILISERLGHEKVQTTLEIYSHLYPNKHDEVAERLDIFKNSTKPVPDTNT